MSKPRSPPSTLVTAPFWPMTNSSLLSAAPFRLVNPAKLTPRLAGSVGLVVPLPWPVTTQVVLGLGPASASVCSVPVAFTVQTFENVSVRSAVGVVTVPLPFAWSSVHVAVSPLTSSELALPVALYVIGAAMRPVLSTTSAVSAGASIVRVFTVSAGRACLLPSTATSRSGPLFLSVIVGGLVATGASDHGAWNPTW